MATDEPPMPGDCFDKYVRQTMGVDLDRFVQPTTFQRAPNQPSDQEATVSLTFEVTEVLALVPEEPSIAAILDLAGDDQPTLWIQQVDRWLVDYPGDAVSILDLQRGLGLSLCEVWIALLLGDMGTSLTQTKNFYCAAGLAIDHRLFTNNLADQESME